MMRLRSVCQRNRYIVLLVGVVIVYNAVLYIHILRNFLDIGSGHDTQYSNVSMHVVRDGIYSMGSRDAAGVLVPTSSVPPLYTLLYAASYRVFGFSPIANEPMRILQMLANIGVIVVIWRVGMLFSVRVANAAATLAAFDLTAFYFAQNYDIPDTLLGFFLAMWLFFLLRYLRGEQSNRYVLWSACFLGLAIWTKFSASLLWVPIGALLIAFLWWQYTITRAQKIQAFMIFFLVIFVSFGGWKIRNYIATGHGAFGSIEATGFLWNASYVVAEKEGITPTEARQQLAKQYLSSEQIFARDEGTVSREVGRVLRQIILDHPILFASATLRAMPGFFLGTFPPYMLFSRDTANALRATVEASHGHRALLAQLWSDGRIGYVLIYAAAKLYLLLLYGAAIVAAIVFVRRRELRWTLAFFVMTIAYVMAVSGASAQARYRTMILPIIYVMGGYGVAASLDWWRRRAHRVRAVASLPATV